MSERFISTRDACREAGVAYAHGRDRLRRAAKAGRIKPADRVEHRNGGFLHQTMLWPAEQAVAVASGEAGRIRDRVTTTWLAEKVRSPRRTVACRLERAVASGDLPEPIRQARRVWWFPRMALAVLRRPPRCGATALRLARDLGLHRATVGRCLREAAAAGEVRLLGEFFDPETNGLARYYDRPQAEAAIRDRERRSAKGSGTAPRSSRARDPEVEAELQAAIERGLDDDYDRIMRRHYLRAECPALLNRRTAA